MTTLSKIVRAGFSLSLLVAAGAGAARRSEPLVAIELESEENTVDECGECGCRAVGGLEPGGEGEWWVTFGLVAPAGGEAWGAAGTVSRCGAGSFEKIAAGFEQTIGTPYVVLDLSAAAIGRRTGETELELELNVRRHAGFSPDGRARYTTVVQKRKLGLAPSGEITLPLLIPDPREKEAFGVHEVLVRLRATILGGEPVASYGAIAVSADVPGAEVRLDGGFVGRIAEGRPLVVPNVRVGRRQIRVRDFSGREAIRQVGVRKNRTATATLALLDRFREADDRGLVALGKNPQGFDELWRARDGALLVRIPAGEFLRGSVEDEGKPHERPQRRIYVSEFVIDKTEVTWRQFRKYAAATGAELPPAPLWGTPDDYPASPIVWEEARKFCQWVGGRLPTEAEWEKAARGVDGRKYPWGDDWYHDRCNSRDGGPHRPLSVGSHPDCRSPYGVLDMSGNVWEWCSDWYGENYYAESPAQDPTGPPEGRERVMRGGAWISARSWLRTHSRQKISPTYRNMHYGLRCVIDPLDR